MKTSPRGTAGLALLASSLLLFSPNLRGQIPAPSDPAADSEAAPEAAPPPLPPPPGFNDGDTSPMENTDVSTMITTGSGYDAWSGSVHRVVRDMSVPGAVSSRGLDVVRTYSSSNGIGWSMSWHWNLSFRGSGAFVYRLSLPDGRTLSFDPAQEHLNGEIALRASRGTKERLIPKNGPDRYSGTADLYLEDGSVVHFNRVTDYLDASNQAVDYFTAVTVTDRYGLVTRLEYVQYGNEYKDTHLTKVIDPSTRSLTFKYEDPRGQSVLTSVMTVK